MKASLYILSPKVARSPIIAVCVLLISISLSILLIWGMAISTDLVFQAIKGRSDAQIRLIIVGTISVAAGVLTSVVSRSYSDLMRRGSWMRSALAGFAAVVVAVVLLNLLSEWQKLRSALLGTAHDFWRFALWPSLISFSLLWSGRVMAHDVERLLTGSRRMRAALSIARGLMGACICATMGAWIAVRHGAELSALHAPRAFYIVVVPAVAGFGWAASWPTTPSRGFIVALLFVALSMAVFTVLRPSSRDNKIECQYWYPTGVHNVFGFRTDFRYEPWRWRLESPFDVLFVPGVLGELTVSYMRDPLTTERC
jgi:hypothetical protein